MNILIPHHWLLEHLETKVEPSEIQKLVSLCGPSIERIYDKEGEPVYDIEVTTNRVDSMSIRGIAREVSVILEEFGHHAKLKNLNLPKVTADQDKTTHLPSPKVTNDPKFCKRLQFVVLDEVKRAPTPEWMAKRLRQTDLNIHDSAIDITNYITHELGHPCHAFDYDKLMNEGGEIIVTTARKGEKFSTLDGSSFTTVGGEVVFKNGRGEIIDLPSIKGTANTSIDQNTKRVLLLFESIIATKVRFASMTHAIRTTAATLMEKNVDPELITPTMELGVKLYQELCGAKIASEVFDEFPGKNPVTPILVPLQKIESYLGLSLEKNKINAILTTLGCEVGEKSNGVLEVTPPTFRPDIAIPADVIEEVARIYGYHKLPSVLMESAIPLTKPTGVNFAAENRAKRFLAANGWQEIYSYSLVSETLAGQAGFALEDQLKLQNPLTDDRVYLRRSLVPSLVEVITTNPLAKDLAVFEIANIYIPGANGQLPTEELHLTLVSLEDYRISRTKVEALLGQFYLPELIIDAKGKMTIGKQGVGEVTKEGKLTAFDFVLPKLWPLIKTHPTYLPISKTSTISEDITFTFEKEINLGEVIALIKNRPLITEVYFKDRYQNNYSFQMNYHDDEKNLSNLDIEAIRKKMISEVCEKFNASLVGTLS